MTASEGANLSKSVLFVKATFGKQILFEILEHLLLPNFHCIIIDGPRREKTCLHEGCEQQRRRPACASAQADQRLCY